MLDELNAIENELDQLLPQYGAPLTTGSFGQNKIFTQVLRDPNQSSNAPSREKVLTQALDLEENISKLNKELQEVNRQMT